MSILSSTNSGTYYFKKPIEDWITKELNLSSNDYDLVEIPNHGRKEPIYEINVNGRDVNLNDYPNEQLPDYIQFGEIVGGNFLCAYSKLTSAKGFPRMVGLTFDCSFSQLTSLDGMPKTVDRDFICLGMPFTEEQIRATTEVTCKVYL
ncbi:MAG: hypothetical protein J6C57_02120 [Paludibacteraceae bacterium]|nr:hypothetical protein [Paludibacteraceae bacterium]